jgi:hypothetical protein
MCSDLIKADTLVNNDKTRDKIHEIRLDRYRTMSNDRRGILLAFFQRCDRLISIKLGIIEPSIGILDMKA